MAQAEHPSPHKHGGKPLKIDLALQGGGAHGAFTWRVLDRSLDEPWLEIDGISGTSAGAMNAAILVLGHARGGAKGAQTALEAFLETGGRRLDLQPISAQPLGYHDGAMGLGKFTHVHAVQHERRFVLTL